MPRELATSNGAVLTSIFKSPVAGRVPLRDHNLEGDRQSDLRVHGGTYKAIYLYPSEHYSYWSQELAGKDMPWGAFGENLTTEGFDEQEVHIGDQFRIGSAILQVTQPRMPCFKLALRFGRSDMVKRFWESGRPGMYFSVVREGDIGAGDSIERLNDGAEQVSVADVVRLFKRETDDRDLYARALRVPLFGSWKKDIQERWEYDLFTGAAE
jgi:MOSC domain-containing protein YiiM